MLRATDGHANNFSIFLRPDGISELTPLYDVLSAYPVIGRGANQLSPFKAKMAVAVRSKNTHWVMRDIVRRHWLAVGKEHGVMAPDGRGAEIVLDDIVTKIPEVVRSVRAMLPDKFPEHVADSILNGLQVAADKLAG
jgi:serine/threonine-protein kinase HipA